MGPTVRVINHRVFGHKAESGEVQSVAPTQGIPPPLPPDNLLTGHSGLHSLGGSTLAISPSHLMGGY